MRIRFAPVAVAVSCLLSASVAPAHAAKAKHHITWLLGHENLDYFEEAAESFKKTVEEGSGGEIAVTIVTDVHDGGRSMPGIAAKVAKGEAEMGHSFADVMGAVDPRFHVFEAPYLFRDYRHLEGVFEGPVGAAMLGDLRSQGLVGLSFTYSGGASGVATAKRELRTLEDLKGLRVGVYGEPLNGAWLKTLGAEAVPVGHKINEIVPKRRDGALDAAVITWRNFQAGRLQAGFDRFSLPDSTYLVSVTYANEKFLAGLPEKHRTLILTASRDAAWIERVKTIELNAEAKRDLLAQGVRPVYASEGLRRAVAERSRASVEAFVGREFLETVLSAKDGPEHPAIPAGFAARNRLR
ncbi:MAG: TRAP transporter substrate-binding protein DctP [Elusimicrobiota bacterium]|nr:TRAP transporter substrate-binding protein DctP [Elusimicrobiota bacterium]